MLEVVGAVAKNIVAILAHEGPTPGDDVLNSLMFTTGLPAGLIGLAASVAMYPGPNGDHWVDWDIKNDIMSLTPAGKQQAECECRNCSSLRAFLAEEEPLYLFSGAAPLPVQEPVNRINPFLN